jgi:YebC/PmpR family DNA-binding regulatory protein
MAGHSHWANIAHKKGIADAKRGKLFSKLSRYIIIAARSGGGDPDTNLKLRYAIDKARSVSMPKDNIERAIKRGTGEGAGEAYEELIYEGFGPGKAVAVMLDLLTDNRNRSIYEIRKIFEKFDGTMGSAGSVGYLFDRKAVFHVATSAIGEDDLMGLVLDAGAEDMRPVGEVYEILCSPAVFSTVQGALTKAKLTPSLAETQQVPKSLVDCEVEVGRATLKMMEALDDNDDVQNVYSNLNVTEAMTAE